MDTPIKKERRGRPRASVTLRAMVGFEGQETGEVEALISNLSATGARLHFEKAGPLSAGRGITLKIFIPNTILKHAAEGEILWVERQHAAVSLGVRFREALSEFMMQRLIET